MDHVRVGKRRSLVGKPNQSFPAGWWRRVRGARGRGVLLFEDRPFPEGQLAREIHVVKDKLACAIWNRGAFGCPFKEEPWHRDALDLLRDPKDHLKVVRHDPVKVGVPARVPVNAPWRSLTAVAVALELSRLLSRMRRSSTGSAVAKGAGLERQLVKRFGERLNVSKRVLGTGAGGARGPAYSFDPTRRMKGILFGGGVRKRLQRIAGRSAFQDWAGFEPGVDPL